MTKLFIAACATLAPLFANEAVVEAVKVTKQDDTYRFAVRILHEDSGWEHYVNKYDVLDRDGKVLATRTLWHPHEHEQPFTRSLSGVKIEGKKVVFVRANDSVDGYSKLFEVRLP